MNRKEMIIVGIVLLGTFVGGVFAAPTVSQTFITNNPLNVRIVGGTPSLQTTSTDIEVIKFAGVLSNQGPSGSYAPLTVGIFVGNLTTSFSFTPKAVFQQINSVKASIVYQSGSFLQSCQACGQPGDMFNFQVNGQQVASIHPGNSNIPLTSVVTLSGLLSGSNVISVSVSNPTEPGFYYVYEVRLTVEYTFLG